MKNLILFIVPLLFIAIGACQNEQKSPEQKKYDLYYDSIMMIHDRTMPLMGKIESLRNELKEVRKEALNTDAKKYLQINNLLAELNKAEDAMYDWMNGFKPDSLPEDQKIQYIQKELSTVDHMEGLMLGSIGMAEAQLEEHKEK